MRSLRSKIVLRNAWRSSLRCKLRTEPSTEPLLAVARSGRRLTKPRTRAGRCPYLGYPLRCRRAAAPLVSPPSHRVLPPPRLTLSKLLLPIRSSQSKHTRQGVLHLCQSRTGAPRSMGPQSRNCPCGIRRDPPWRIPSTNETPALGSGARPRRRWYNLIQPDTATRYNNSSVEWLPRQRGTLAVHT